MLAQYLDLIEEFNANNGFVIIDVSNYDYTLIQPISGTIDSVQSTLSSGAINGVSDGSAVSANGFSSAVGILVEDGVTYTSSISSDKIVRFGVVGRYLKISGDIGMKNLLVMLAKIS